MEILELTLQRYKQGLTGTTGKLSEPGSFICYTIELPWKDNQRKVSCVKAGRYKLKIEDSPAHGICLEMLDVPGRGDCQFHKANWALSELQGCIAPVTTPDEKPGIGWGSGTALKKLEDLCFPVIRGGGEVFVTIIDVPTLVVPTPVVAPKAAIVTAAAVNAKVSRIPVTK